MSRPYQCAVVIPAAGSGSRFGGDVPKQYLQLRGRAVLAHTIQRFLDHSAVTSVVIAVAATERERAEHLVKQEGFARVRAVDGGATRHESVLNALRSLEAEAPPLVAVHDSVRPFFSDAMFDALLDAADTEGAAVPLLSLTDTIHRVRGEVIVETPDRAQFGLAQTPQCFRFWMLLEAMTRGLEHNVIGTDEGGVVSRYGHRVHVVPGETMNIKITHASDLRLAEELLQRNLR
jgi:2-C-methyl-D-erythritol 4-phosphate cytidylyltransferase